MIHAFVDESESNRDLDPHAYLLGAAVVFEDNVAHVREAMAALLLPGQRKVHWRDESLRRRRRIIHIVAGLPIEAVLVAHVDKHRKPNARRNRALATLLVELNGLGVGQVDIESRGHTDDNRDRKLLDGLRSSRRLEPTSHKLRMDHPTGPSDSGLWVADAICGAVLARRTGDPQFTDVLGSRLREIDSP